MRWYYRKLSEGLIIAHARPEFAHQVESLQLACFPTLAEEERFQSRHHVRHIELFGSGQFVPRGIAVTPTLPDCGRSD